MLTKVNGGASETETWFLWNRVSVNDDRVGSWRAGVGDGEIGDLVRG